MISHRPDIIRSTATWCLAAVILIVVAANIPHAGHYFSQDDWAALNVGVENTRDVTDFFIPNTKAASFTYRPLSFHMKFWLMREAFGLNPVPHHLLPLLFHCINILLLYRFLLLLTRRRDIALLAAVLYGLSGAHQMALYWVSAGLEPMAALFYLLGLNTFMAWRRNPGILRATAIGLLFISALLSKESSITFPFALLLIDYFFPEEPGGKSKSSSLLRIALFIFIFIIAITHAVLCLAMLSKNLAGGSAYALVFNPLTLALNLSVYFGSVFAGNAIIFGLIQGLGSEHPRQYVTGLMQSPVGAAVGLVFIAAIVLVAGWIRRTRAEFEPHERRLITWGFAWFVICLLPVLPMPGHNYAYYLNIPLIGFSGCLAALVLGFGRRISRHSTRRFVGYTLLALYLANFGVNTHLGARITNVARQAADARNVVEQISEIHPSFEKGTVLFILGIDDWDWWVMDNGQLFKAYYPGQLRDCFLIKKDSRLSIQHLESHGWGMGGNAVFYSYDEKILVPRDKQYFIDEYTTISE